MPFATETSLEEAISYIKKATTDASMPRGIPIYIDPVGLNEAEKTMMSPICLDMEGVPLSHSLKLLLKQLDLRFEVRDGLMTITYVKSTHDPDAERLAFLQIGHCWFAILAGILGGMLGRWFYRTRDVTAGQASA